MTHVNNKGLNKSFITSTPQYRGNPAKLVRCTGAMWRSGLRAGVVAAIAGLMFGCGTPGSTAPSASAPTNAQESPRNPGSTPTPGGGTGNSSIPTVSITAPTSGAPYTSPGSTVNITGTATDDVGVSRVTWSNSLGGSGTVSGTTNWSANAIPLQQGQNVITITAFDSAQNSGSVSFIVYFGVAASNTYYVATNGSDLFGNGSSSSPWATIGHGVSRMASGDTLIVKRGIYTGTANFIANVPSGIPGGYTTVMAEAPMEVRIQSNGPTNDGQLQIAGSYIKVDGFIFDMANNSGLSHIGTIEAGSFNKITRCIFKRSGPITQWGGLLALGGSDNLVEDVAGVGACRYCFEQGGPDSTAQRNIWRRVVARFDYGNSPLPKATFATYGNNQTNPAGGMPLVRDHLYQNVIIIDGQNPVISGAQPKYGGMYTAKTASNIRFEGAIVLNEDAGLWGLFNREWTINGWPTANNSVSHTVVWGLKGNPGGIKANTADHVTVGGFTPSGALDLTSTETNSLILPAVSLGNLLVNATGATITKRQGVSGTLWGEPGYNQTTNDDLWPWPYEDKIKAVFAETNNPPSGYSPLTNNTKRGFAADGNGRYGGPITLTSYIWEFLGTPCPPNVCPQ